MRKRLAVIGLGGWACSMHVPVFRRLQEEGRAEYCGLCDRDESKAKRAALEIKKGNVYTDLDQMLASEKPDGLIILVKPDAAPGLIQRAIELRLPFLTEKPPSTSVLVHQRLIDGAKDLPHVIAYNRRFTPYAVKANEWLSGLSLQTVDSSFCRFHRLEPDFTGTAVHAIDSVLFLAGNPVAEARIEAVKKDTVFNFFITAWTKSNCRLSILVTPDTPCNEETYSMRATSRCVRIFHPLGEKDAGRVQLFEGNQVQQELAARDFGISESDRSAFNGILNEHRHFIDVLEGRQRSLSTLQDTLNTQIIREACAGLLTNGVRQVKELVFEKGAQ
jgi:predicted dehydrogenase